MAKMARKKTFSDKDLILSSESSFIMKEDYKAIRTNLEFSFPGAGGRVIAVTSCNRSEGKSTNAINMAISFAELGKNVVLVDCDLRLPTIMSKLRDNAEKNRQGLSEVLVGTCGLNKAIFQSGIPNLYVMPSGTIPPDSTRLLDSERMQVVLETLKKTFDYIILDCPPVGEVIDALIMSAWVDGYVLIIKHGETEHRDIRKTLEKMQIANANVLGYIYVNAPSEDKKYYKKYGKYGYKKYGYEYRKQGKEK